MREIVFRIWPSEKKGMWYAEIDGKKYGPTTIGAIEDLQRRALYAIKEEIKRDSESQH